MVDRIFRMSDQTAYSLMTPRTQMRWLDLEDSPSYNLQLIKKYPDTVFPVGRNNLDDFCGVLYTKDLLNAAIAKKSLDIQAYIKKPLFTSWKKESPSPRKKTDLKQVSKLPFSLTCIVLFHDPCDVSVLFPTFDGFTLVIVVFPFSQS